MKTTLSFSVPAEVETECLAVVVLDRAPRNGGEKDKPEPYVATTDKAVQQAAAEAIRSGEVTGKSLETTLLHQPKLKAKRLLLIGGGKSDKFTACDVRKLAGTAVRFLKPRGLRSLAFVTPDGTPAEEA